MFALSPHTIIRPEPHGALMFQQETAETALLDLEGLEALYSLCSHRSRSEQPIFFVHYLLDKGLIVRGAPNGSTERVAEVLDLAPITKAPPRSLAAPETIHFSVTGRCDQACEGCFYSARSGSKVEPADAPFSLFQKVVTQAGKASVFQMALGGGEPLLHPQIVEMVRLARAHNIVPNVTTNGNLLHRDLAMALKEAGLGQVQLSLNGTMEKTNAKTRPNFRQTMRALETCREVGLRFGINFLVTRSTVGEFPAVVALGRRLGAASVNLLRPKPPTTEGDWLERESLDAAGYRQLVKLLSGQVAGRKPQTSAACDVEPATCGLRPETRITLDASLTFLLTEHPPEQLYQGGVWGCCAARKFVTVVQDGAVLPCSHVRWSDVGEGDFTKAWWESEVFARFRAQEEMMCGQCGACRYLELCKGCRAVVMAFGGDFADSDPHCPKANPSAVCASSPTGHPPVRRRPS
jgi:radical SAM protein with 4Fe4S-binding SPASM domain